METKTKNVLVVEDDKDFTWILKQGFEGQSFLVSYAADGQEGFEMAQKLNPDLIIMDILLPKMDGVATAKKIKENGIKSQIIFLTNMKDIEHVSAALDAAGQTDYIIKSDVHMDIIVKRVKEKLGLS